MSRATQNKQQQKKSSPPQEKKKKDLEIQKGKELSRCGSEIYSEEISFSIRAVDLDLQGLGECRRGQALFPQWHKMQVVTANE